ncbi:SAM-dependent methyltransferase [Leptospira wolffii]|uniref:SAM-dependent methyltransferase n=1 Tax=Leptospira wolffii TaxID=409998 RepID=A0A2M9Z8Z2_9LEPT|nr:class I SAM-dependent methyltransferase [Leptospira wolffii]PJZ64893.1 SAM-dependent methyltransferase [Leptospira wolffii]
MQFVEKFEGERAREYENRIGKMIPMYNGILELVPTLLLELTPENGNILGVGCGTGGDFRNLIRIAPERFRITGIDPSPEMIEQAKSKFPGIRFFADTVDKLPSNELYHSTTLLFVLHFLPDDGSKLTLLKDIYSRLKEGGNLILFDLYNSYQDEKIQFAHAASYLRNFQGWKEDNLRIYLERVSQLHKISGNRYSELLQEAGFIEIRQIFQCLHVGGWLATKRV